MQARIRSADHASRRCAGTLGILLALGGCVSYAPAPIDVAGLAAEQRARAIDTDAVRAELTRIAPDYDWRDGQWNGLTLLAAGLTTSPALEKARAAVRAAEAEAAAARVSPGPTLSLTAEYAFNPPEASHWLYDIASDLLLDRGGRREGRIETADVAARAAAFDYAAAVWSLRSALRRALDARAAWQAEAALAQELVAMRRRQLEAVNRRVTAGEISRLDLDRVRADMAADARTEATARASAARTTLDLAAALGVPPDALDAERIEVEGALEPEELGGIDDDDVGAALEARPEILAATAAYDRAEAALRTAVASQFPEIRIGPGYQWERGLSKLPFSLSLALPTSDRARSAIAAAEARRAEAGQQLEAAVATVTASITRAEADYRAAWDVLELVRTETLPTARAIAEQADLELEAGAVNRADWAASQAGLLRARLDEIAALRSVLETETALEDALRRPLHGTDAAIGRAVTDSAEEEVR